MNRVMQTFVNVAKLYLQFVDQRLHIGGESWYANSDIILDYISLILYIRPCFRALEWFLACSVVPQTSVN